MSEACSYFLIRHLVKIKYPVDSIYMGPMIKRENSHSNCAAQIGYALTVSENCKNRDAGQKVIQRTQGRIC